jgi:hypothetical protein
MGTKHKHYDVIVAWASGEEVEAKIGDNWMGVAEKQPFFCESTEYRIKPKLVKKEGWVNVYADSVGFLYGSKEKADISPMKDRKACIRIEWEETVE